MCTYVHISVTKRCIAGLVHCGTCATSLFLWLWPANITSPGYYFNKCCQFVIALQYLHVSKVMYKSVYTDCSQYFEQRGLFTEHCSIRAKYTIIFWIISIVNNMICCFLQKVSNRTIMSDWLIHIILLYSPVLGYHMLHIENNCITHTSHNILIDWVRHISQEATTGTSTPVPYHQVESPPPSRWLGIHSLQSRTPDPHAGHRDAVPWQKGPGYSYRQRPPSSILLRIIHYTHWHYSYTIYVIWHAPLYYILYSIVIPIYERHNRFAILDPFYPLFLTM